jgi:hypothetical protein
VLSVTSVAEFFLSKKKARRDPGFPSGRDPVAHRLASIL